MSKISSQHLGLISFMLLMVSGCSYFDFSADPRICDDIYIVAEQMPVLKGGMAELQGNVVYPQEAREAGIEGRVTVQFVVNKLGDPINLQVIRGIGGGADEVALEAIEQAKFEPGEQNHKPVCVQYQLSINFRLEN